MDHCDEYLELISAAIDGALSPEELTRLEAHLAQCPGCRALYEDFAAMHSALSEVPPVTLPPVPAYMARVNVALDHQMDLREAKAKRRRAWRNWTAAAAVLAIVLVGRAGFTGRDLAPRGNEAQVAARGLDDPAPATGTALTEEGSPHSNDQALPPADSTTIPETAAEKREETAVTKYTAAAQPPEPTAKEAVPTAATPAPVLGAMARSLPLPAGDGGADGMEELAAETADEVADTQQPPAAQPFMASLPLPSELPEGEEPESANILLTTAAESDEMAKNGALPEEAAPENTLLTPREALELAAQYVLASRETPGELEQEDSEAEDGSPVRTLRWQDGEAQHQVRLQCHEQDHEPDVYYIDCIWEDSENGAGAFLYLVDKTTGNVSAMCTD